MEAPEKKYKEWIKILADYQGGRPHYADQTIESMEVLSALVGIYNPECIIELGTAHGLSTRLWLDITEGIPIHCVDASFTALRGTSSVLPVDFSRLTLHENWVRDVNLQGLWGDKKTLLYVDVHSDHAHVFRAIPDLPHGSIVVFDDVWRSGKKLITKEDQEAFRLRVVAKQVDHTAPMEIWPRSYADYPMGKGGFYGFSEVPEIMQFVAHHKIKCHWEVGAKVLWFQWPQDKE